MRSAIKAVIASVIASASSEDFSSLLPLSLM
jgi:hypothetical protein